MIRKYLKNIRHWWNMRGRWYPETWHRNYHIWRIWTIQRFLRWWDRGQNKNKIPHWYRIIQDGCVLCGRNKTYREYMYGRKPRHYSLVNDFNDYACEWHF